MPDDRSSSLGRRAFLGAVGVAAVGGTAWWVNEHGFRIGDLVDDIADGAGGVDPGPAPRARPTPVDAADLTAHESVAGSRLYYEVSGEPSAFRMQDAFADKLDASLRSHWQATRWGVPGQVWSHGTWVSQDARDGASWHHEGRAFDLTSVRTTSGDVLASCRYDRWRSTSGAERATQEREYWRLAATLLRDFGTVLTYLYDEAHHDHIHLDDGRSPDGRSRFRVGSRTQVHGVQAICTHVWGEDVPITGTWDSRTRDVTAGLLDTLGVGGRLTSGQDHWHAFLDASARRD